MKNFIIYSLLFFSCASIAFGQPSNFQAPLSVNEDGTNPDKSAMLDIQSANKGLLIPRLPYCDIEKITDPAEGLMIFDTEFHCLRIYIQGKWHCLYQNLNDSNSITQVSGWANPTFDEDLNTSIAIDSKENLYVTMVTEDDEIRLTKFDNKGNILWNIMEYADHKHGLAAVDLHDNIFTAAATEGEDYTISFNGVSVNESGEYITKTSSDGIRTDIFALPNANIRDLAIDKNGNVFFAFTFFNDVTFGGTTYKNTTIDDAVKVGIAKLDNNLNEMWIIVLDAQARDTFKYAYNMPISIVTDETGDIYVAGHHNNGVDQLPIDQSEIKTFNIFVAKFSGTDGRNIWAENHASDNELFGANLEYVNNTLFLGTEVSYSTGFRNRDALIKRFGAYGNILGTISPPGKEYQSHFTVNKALNEIAISYIPYDELNNSFNNNPVITSTYKSGSNDPIKVVEHTFYGGGAITYNKDGSKIYGIGVGEVIGNTIIEEEQGSENHIIYKIYND